MNRKAPIYTHLRPTMDILTTEALAHLITVTLHIDMRLVRLFMLNHRIYAIVNALWPQVASSPLMLLVTPSTASLGSLMPTAQRPAGLHTVKYCRHYCSVDAVYDPYDHFLVIAVNGQVGYIYIRRAVIVFEVRDSLWWPHQVRYNVRKGTPTLVYRPAYCITLNKCIIDKALRDAVYLMERLAPELLGAFVFTAAE